MTAGRLTFLYPHLCRSGRWGEPAAAHLVATKSRRPSPTSLPPSLPSCHHVAPFTNQPIRREAKRHGKAVEPMKLPALEQSTPAESKPDAKQGSVEGKHQGDPPAQERAPRPAAVPTEQPDLAPQTHTTPSPLSATSSSPDKSPASSQGTSDPSQPDPPPPPPPPPPSSNPGDDASPDDLGKKAKGTSGPMDTILHMGPPPSSEPSPSRFPSDSTRDPSGYKWAPHLHPPPYVHHFDSYSLVKQLSAGGYTLGQSITAMKAVRNLLASNLDVAQSELVSKADVDNESYLFRAACSELSTEVQNNRRVADEQLRQQRTMLQHEVDILAQQLNQEILTLNDAVRGMFNDRRMVVREEQKALENRVQQINYKISVSLTADAKSEIESLRWVIIRRATIGIIFVLFTSLATLRYGSYINQQRKEAAALLRQEAEREAEAARRNVGKIDATDAPAAAQILAAGG